MYKTIIYSPIASLVLVVMSGSFFLTFITVKIKYFENAEFILGLIHSAFYGGLLVGSLKSEEIINRVGHIRAFACFSSLLTFTIILQAIFEIPKLWIFIRFIAGFCTAAAYVIIESWLLAQSTKYNKGKILSIYMVALYSTQTISQLAIDYVDYNSMLPFLLAALICSLSVIPASMTYLEAPVIKPSPKVAISKYFMHSPLGFVGCTISGLMISAIYSFLPYYAVDNEISVSILNGITIFGGFCLQWPIGKLSDIFDRTKIITALGAITTLLCIIIVLLPLHIYVLYLLSFCIGGLTFTLYPVCIAKVCDNLENENIVNVTSVLLFAYGIGAAVGPTFLSLIIKYSSSGAIFYYMASVSIILVIAGIYTTRTETVVPDDQQVDFVAVARSSPLANKLDPRS